MTRCVQTQTSITSKFKTLENVVRFLNVCNPNIWLIAGKISPLMDSQRREIAS